MKIRWYHWLVYKVFRYFWDPILTENYGMRKKFIQHMVDFDNAQTEISL